MSQKSRVTMSVIVNSILLELVYIMNLSLAADATILFILFWLTLIFIRAKGAQRNELQLLFGSGVFLAGAVWGLAGALAQRDWFQGVLSLGPATLGLYCFAVANRARSRRVDVLRHG
jgi:hypothetical protein